MIAFMRAAIVLPSIRIISDTFSPLLIYILTKAAMACHCSSHNMSFTLRQFPLVSWLHWMPLRLLAFA